MINVCIHNGFAKIPTKGSEYSAGYDLYSCEDGIIGAKQRKIINTGIKIEIPTGLYGRIAPRSGLALKYGIDVFAGVIDSDYRGEIKCILYNSGDDDYIYHIGDRIAQIIFEKYYDFNLNITNSLEHSERQDNGFGSTG